ncbi:MAG: hypothetical protein GOVbin2066_55 [Prokaryotic dsDNA virus sp.]|nr:MAG: hypothetical protein GOVbin2066_55 [Prokaryotic dsDNA virus sp.]|tara:strand:- start:5421 stop:6089 length:669 start_codon:yes stop_codon:yes gene_type:complete
MATRKEYSYQIKGNKLSLLEKDFETADGLNYRYTEGAGLDGSTGSTIIKSPTSDVTDGIELEYTYSPNYIVNDASDTVSMTEYTESSGLLSITVASITVVADEWILITGSNKWNGLHQVNANVTGGTTVVLKTKYNGGTVTGLTATVSHDVSVLEDESFELDLPTYLSKALVYYVKAKVAEDAMNLELKEYSMREFKKMLEKHENSKVAGPRMIMSGRNALR